MKLRNIKICVICGVEFDYDCSRGNKVEFYKFYAGNNMVQCPVCLAVYYAVWNELNDFVYLEFARIRDKVA